MRKIIDLETYPRRSHYEYFRSLAFPYVALTANVEVTNLVRYARSRGGSTFLACLWAAAQAANAIPELRQRIVDDQIVEFDHCNVGHTVAMEDNTFCNCYTECRMSLGEFLVDAKQRQEEAKKHPGFVNPDEDETGLIFTSCMPWVSFTQVVQPVPIPADCNPRIIFGKYFQDGEKTMMPLHIQCNHALVDGYHIAQFFRNFEKINAEL